MTKIFLRHGREESLKRFHPWVFSGAIHHIQGEPLEGDIVQVCAADGSLLGCGHYQVGSITVRMLSFDSLALSSDFWEKRIGAAYEMRSAIGLAGSEDTNSYRLVHGEGDQLSGLIIDYYNGHAVIQAHSAGMFRSREKIVEALKHVYGSKLTSVYDKSSGTAPFKAGLELSDGYIYGNPQLPVEIKENGHIFSVDWESGQKTGFFLDQRDNRSLVKKYSAGRNVLNLFCYTGGFSIYALAGGAASVDSVDSSQKAMELLEINIEKNRASGIIGKEQIHKGICEDAIEYLRNCPTGKYDLMIVDPPAFAKHRGAISNALRAYQRLNAAAIDRVAPGGIIITYSCSQVVDKIAFAQVVFSAAAQTGRNVRILHRLSQPADHPVSIYHPEGEYLKGLVIYVE
ncbi:MAG: SAM-dependent methyltransferase [Bacteroidetes bacterium GWF2_40_14]|nr:MAG: SAM-dependent methyltransferase [Bacteroidetes bacterium GWF2_40_14]